MDRKSKILFGVFVALIVLSVSASFYKFMVLQDYLVEAQVDCDPSVESCFVWECDATAEECTGNPEEDIWYFKLAFRNAKNIPLCEPLSDTCQQFECPAEGEVQCTEILCNAETLAEYDLGETCTNSANFKGEDVNEATDYIDEEIESEDAAATEGAGVANDAAPDASDEELQTNEE